jgi:hypothetical protein
VDDPGSPAKIALPVAVRALRLGVLATLVAVLTLTLQSWVGGVTIYRPELADKRLTLHEAILHNRPPGQSWVDGGAARTNVRVFTVFMAEGIKRATGMGVLNAYFLLDTTAMLISFILLFAYLESCLPAILSLVGILYFASVTTLTYHLHYFHPWDRLSTLCWLIAIMLVRAQRFWALLALLPVAVAVKWDIIAIPAFYALGRWPGRWDRSYLLRTVALLSVAAGTFVALSLALPNGGREAANIVSEVPRRLDLNLQQVLALKLSYPPLLAFALPVLLAVVGFRDAPFFDRACCVFAALLSLTLLLLSNFAEVRAHMMILILLMPTALIGTAKLTTSDSSRPRASA